MIRRNFKLVYMVPVGLDEVVKERIVRTFNTMLNFEKIKKIIFEAERSAGHWPLDLVELEQDDV